MTSRRDMDDHVVTVFEEFKILEDATTEKFSRIPCMPTDNKLRGNHQQATQTHQVSSEMLEKKNRGI